jgi:DNA-binding transcriptional MerR regulator
VSGRRENQESVKSPALLRIDAAARVTGVSAHALRMWERRYGSIASERSEGGYRLYTGDDLARIRLIKELLDRGHSIGQLATLDLDSLSAFKRQELGEPHAAEVLPIAQLTRTRFFTAIEKLDSDEAERTLAAARIAFGTYALITDVIAPILTEVGDRWHDGSISVAHEHAASAVVRGQLFDLLRTLRVSRDAPPVVCTTPEGELHEMGAMMSAVVLGDAGMRCVYLGPSLPASDIGRAVKLSKAGYAVISLVGLEQEQAERELGKIRRAVPKSVPILIGGAAAPTSLPSGMHALVSFRALRNTLLRE